MKISPFVSVCLFLYSVSFSQSNEGKTSLLTRELLLPQITNALTEDPRFDETVRGARFELSVLNFDQSLTVPAEQFSTEIIFQAKARLIGKVPTQINVYTDEKLFKRFWVNVQIDVFKDVYFAKKFMNKGEQLVGANLEAKTVNIADYPPHVLTAGEPISGYQTARTVAIDSPITREMLQSAALAKKGQIVVILVKNGLLTVSCRGILLQDGYLDQPVIVQNMDSRKIVYGRMIGADHVVVGM